MTPRALTAVRARADFDALSRSRDRARSGPVRVARADMPTYRPANGSGDDRRVAYAIGRAVGTAVVRNRLRRRLRVLMHERAAHGALPPGLYLVSVRPEAAELPFDSLRHHVDRALAALAPAGSTPSS